MVTRLKPNKVFKSFCGRCARGSKINSPVMAFWRGRKPSQESIWESLGYADWEVQRAVTDIFGDMNLLISFES
jgi:hypothetical protein